jgi:hypothetical protein
LPEEHAAIWRSASLEEEHPFATFKAGVFILADALDSPEMVETAEMYEFIAERSLSTLYKAFFRFTSPQFAIRNYPRLWRRFFNAGEVHVPMAEEGQAELIFTLPEIFLDWLPPACLGYSQKAVQMAGGKHFTMRQLEKRAVTGDIWEVKYKLGWR